MNIHSLVLDQTQNSNVGMARVDSVQTSPISNLQKETEINEKLKELQKALQTAHDKIQESLTPQKQWATISTTVTIQKLYPLLLQNIQELITKISPFSAPIEQGIQSKQPNLDQLTSSMKKHKTENPLCTTVVQVERPDFSRLLGKESTSDVIFSLKEERFYAHSTILKAHSEFFTNLLHPGLFSRGNKFMIQLSENISSEAFKTFLNYIYTNRINLNVDTLIAVYHLAILYQIDVLKNDCEDYLDSILSAENCLRFLQQFPHELQKSDAYQTLFRYVLLYAPKIMVENNNDFKRLPSEIFWQLLKSDDLHIPQEEKVIEVAAIWLNARSDDKAYLKQKTQECIRTGILNLEQLWTNPIKVWEENFYNQKDLTDISSKYYDPASSLYTHKLRNGLSWYIPIRAGYSIMLMAVKTLAMAWRMPVLSLENNVHRNELKVSHKDFPEYSIVCNASIIRDNQSGELEIDLLLKREKSEPFPYELSCFLVNRDSSKTIMQHYSSQSNNYKLQEITQQRVNFRMIQSSNLTQQSGFLFGSDIVVQFRLTLS